MNNSYDYIEKSATITIHCSKNQFISVMRKKNIMNLHPFEHLYDDSSRSRMFFRETIRIIGKCSFGLYNSLTSLVFPPSVEIIGDAAFF